ncbi:MAG: type II methionyl aminopeptidase [Candidatus Anstonellales archaeon]
MLIKDIAKRIRDKIIKDVKPGVKLIDIANGIENAIFEYGAKPAFPLNISIGHIAAHATPAINDNAIIGNELVKVDFGIALDGIISDNAITLDFNGNFDKIVECSEMALQKAIEEIKPGKTIKEISNVIYREIKKYDFKPISNLTGHKIEGMHLHSGITLPNVPVNDVYVIKEGDVFAIEPFVTSKDASGYVVEKNEVEIYSYLKHSRFRFRESKIIADYIKDKYGILPFAERWIYEKVNNKILLHAALKEMLSLKSIQAYPILEEQKKGQVAQAEKTVIVTKDGCEPLISD